MSTDFARSRTDLSLDDTALLYPERQTRSSLYDWKPIRPPRDMADHYRRSAGADIGGDRGSSPPYPRTMTRNKQAFSGPTRHMNTLDRPATGSNPKGEFVSNALRRSLYPLSSGKSTHSQQVNGSTTSQRTLRNGIRGPESNPNPAYKPPKRQKTGELPMQGRSVHDAISLDDSSESIVVDDIVDHQPALPMKAINHLAEQELRARHAEQVRRFSSDQASVNDRQGLRNRGQPRKETRPIANQHAKRQSVEIVDTDDEGQFTKGAAAQRKAEEKQSNGFAKALTDLIDVPKKSPHLVNRKPTPLSSAGRNSQSASPDPLHGAKPTISAATTNGRKQNRPQQNMTQQSASNIANSIVGNDESTKISHFASKQAKRFGLDNVSWYCFDHLPKGSMDLFCIVIDLKQSTFYFELKEPLNKLSGDANDPVTALNIKQPLSRIRDVKYAEKCGTLIINLSHIENQPDGPVIIDLGSEKNVFDLIKTLQKALIDLDTRVEDVDRLRKMYQVATAKRSEQMIYKQQKLDAEAAVVQSRQSAVAHKKVDAQQGQRLVDKLDQPQRTVITGKDRQMESRPTSSDPWEPHRRLTRRSGATQELQSEYFANPQTQNRALRSRNVSTRKEESPKPPRIRFSETGGLGQPWKQSLEYPNEGKKREYVSFDDLKRLDEDEFLNDTLISFFQRYITHRTEVERPDVMKKLHFFNSYLYETLNKGTKGAKNINYQSVARWTSKVDLFSRDFVIVPVNESLHWFVAIICNLPYFRKTDEEREAEKEEEEKDPEKEPTPTQETRQSFGDLTIGETTKTPPKRGRRKAKRPSLQKYDTSLPIIITLDSLGSARSATCSALKQYIVLEAKDKRNLDISEQDIKAMTAKNIPTQGNWSDCGLYLCMYLEQFLVDPHRFVEKLLRREESAIRWPKKIESEALRSRMRNLIMNLHKQQEGKKDVPLPPEVGKILVDMLGEAEVIPDSPQPERKRRHSQDDDTADLEADDDGFKPHEDFTEITASSQARLNEEALRLVDKPITIPDDSSPVKKRRKTDSPEQKAALGRWEHGNPAQLANMMKESRSPKRIVVEDTPDPDVVEVGSRRSPQRKGPEKMPEPKPKSTRTSPIKSQPKSRTRSPSVSTDYLTGNKPYEDNEPKGGDNVMIESHDPGGDKTYTIARDKDSRTVMGEIPVQVQHHPSEEASAAEESERQGDGEEDDDDEIEIQALRSEVPETQSQSQPERQSPTGKSCEIFDDQEGRTRARKGDSSEDPMLV
jgi:hypothetical protein